jgi:hypothetical protein
MGDVEQRLEEIEQRLQEIEDRRAQSLAAIIYVLGAPLAAILSWDANRAVLWAVIHTCLSWFYVGYYVIVHWQNTKLF